MKAKIIERVISQNLNKTIIIIRTVKEDYQLDFVSKDSNSDYQLFAESNILYIVDYKRTYIWIDCDQIISIEVNQL